MTKRSAGCHVLGSRGWDYHFLGPKGWDQLGLRWRDHHKGPEAWINGLSTEPEDRASSHTG